ncbi:embryo-specific protein ATS3B-like isoform X2 [Rhodamnia argentea]|uniref:Embryo-specific protein ATS3B-like isoform X2 n=1 Tax=Rhodamnia argentea TaxID=178133 RepID=A0ABM3GZF7_9MYRT|nr:embryo-specific protein ATS3B-like isoform X2 [Rhodamnia argentea]
MIRRLSFVLWLSLLSVAFGNPRSVVSQPHALKSFKNEGTCTYTVSVRTSCLSTSNTRDQISLVFGDGYGNQVYVPRLDSPSSRAFERCSTDTFQINGPCAYQICYLYLFRNGHDGWRPKHVTVQAHASSYYGQAQPVTFYYGTFIPRAVWYGFNYCAGRRVAPS